MTLAWRGENGLMLKNPAKGGAAFRCDCCPCYTGGWYIATVCPCLNCGHAGPAFIGDLIPEGNAFVTVDWGPNNEMVNLKCLTMQKLTPRDSANDPNHPFGSVARWPCMTVPTKSILYAVRHKTIPAPFDGSVGAKLYLNGAFIGSYQGPQACSENDEVEIGYELDVSAPVIGLGVYEQFSSEGINNVDLVVTFHPSAEGVEDVVYACRTSITVVDPGEEFNGETRPWVGTVGIVPEYTNLDIQECVIEGEDPVSHMTVGMYFKALKGPFATRADAEAVLAEFGAFIRAYAASCDVCEQGPCDIGVFGIDQVVGSSGWCEIEEFGAIDDRAPGPRSCTDAWLRWTGWEINLTEGAPFEIKVERWNYDGTIDEIPYDSVPSDGVFPPCSGGYHVYVQKIDPNFDWANIHDWMSIEGYDEYLFAHPNCVVTDEESQFYEYLWDYEHPGDLEHPEDFVEGQTGVPNNTQEWLDYQCWRDSGGYWIDGECVTP